jgi:hypothetical protein
MMTDEDNVFKLSMKNRMYIFIGCTINGLLTSLEIVRLFFGKYVSYSAMCNIGNISLLSLLFVIVQSCDYI